MLKSESCSCRACPSARRTWVARPVDGRSRYGCRLKSIPGYLGALGQLNISTTALDFGHMRLLERDCQEQREERLGRGRPPHESCVSMRRISLRVVCRLSDGMPNARTKCSYCNSKAVSDLAHVLRLPGADVFQCRTCRELWHVPKDHNWPPSQELLRLKELETA